MSDVAPLPQTPDQLFAVGTNGIIVPHDILAQDQAAVPQSERYIHLLNAIELFDKVVKAVRVARIYPIPKNAPETYIPSKQQAMSLNSAKTAERLRTTARQEFYSAYGATAILANDLKEPDELAQEAAKEYDRFTMRLAGSHKKDARKKARELWSGLLQYNLHPEAGKPESLEQVNDVPEKEPGLSTHEKLIILAEAEDAGFLPTTNEEKSTAMAYLDYINNPTYLLGTQSQLLEVGNFHATHHKFTVAKEFALQAGRSIAHEFADWYMQASKQLADLEEVKQLLHEVDNPNLSLAVALNSNMMKAVPLIRFMDLAELRAKEKIEYIVDGRVESPKFVVLRTRRNEADESVGAGKNKVLEDPYTGALMQEAPKQWLKKRMAQIKVKDVRELLDEAILDQANRAAFHKLVLEDLAHEASDSEMLQEASKVAQGILQQVA